MRASAMALAPSRPILFLERSSVLKAAKRGSTSHSSTTQAPGRFWRRRGRPTPRAHAREPVVADLPPVTGGPVGVRHRPLRTLGEVEAQEAGLDGGADGGLDVAPARVLVRLREGRLARPHPLRKPLGQLTLHPHDSARAQGEELRLGVGARRLVEVELGDRRHDAERDEEHAKVGAQRQRDPPQLARRPKGLGRKGLPAREAAVALVQTDEPGALHRRDRAALHRREQRLNVKVGVRCGGGGARDDRLR
ncbi:hypothetical protein Ctob_010824, partial [Chrysochromulina tobinii]